MSLDPLTTKSCNLNHNIQCSQFISTMDSLHPSKPFCAVLEPEVRCAWVFRYHQ